MFSSSLRNIAAIISHPFLVTLACGEDEQTQPSKIILKLQYLTHPQRLFENVYILGSDKKYKSDC